WFLRRRAQRSDPQPLPQRVWLLGASRPAMVILEQLLRGAGELVFNVSSGIRPDFPIRPQRIYLVDCAPFWSSRLQEVFPGIEIVRLDPQRDRPPAEFFDASVVGQVLRELGIGVGVAGQDRNRRLDDTPVYVSAPGLHVCRQTRSGLVAPEGLLDDMHPRRNADPEMSRRIELARRLPIGADVALYTAAFDQCLEAARRGECPGIDTEMLELYVESLEQDPSSLWL
ncbi:MAG TPA: hypothetical protein VF282_05530, partial [Bacillota bacterium]